MKVSIIVPLYGVESVVKNCIQSIVCQEYDDLELVVVDDASSDNSFQVVEDYIFTNGFQEKTVFVRHEKNKGLSGARNTGILKATGDYIFFLDSDDSLTSSTIISELIDSIPNGGQPDLVVGRYQTLIANQIVEVTPNIEGSKFNKHDAYRVLTTKKLPWSACGRLIKREFLLENQLFFVEGIYSEDLLWSFYLFQQAKYVIFSNVITFNYIRRDDSIMSAINKKHVVDINFIIGEMYKSYQEISDLQCKETAVFIERTRRLALNYLFKFNLKDQKFILEQLTHLKRIYLPLLSTGKIRFFKQNLLLRFPVKFIDNYLSWKWR